METQKVTRKQVKNDYLMVHEFIEYLRWMAEMDDSFELTAGQVWQMFQMGVREGIMWSEVADDLNLPDMDWTLASD